jgi:hypothetical protein
MERIFESDSSSASRSAELTFAGSLCICSADCSFSHATVLSPAGESVSSFSLPSCFDTVWRTSYRLVNRARLRLTYPALRSSVFRKEEAVSMGLAPISYKMRTL